MLHCISYRRRHALMVRFVASPAPPAGKPKLIYIGGGVAAAAARRADGISLAKATWPLQVDTDRIVAPKLSKSDAAFQTEGCDFVWGGSDLSIEELNKLFVRVGFPKRDPQKLSEALIHTHTILWIRSNRRSRWAKLGQLLGFARATSDGALSATIWDVAVDPGWQRGGLGRAAVERLTASLVEEGIQTITLYAEPGVVGLYKKLGFAADPEGIKGMAFQRKSKKGRELVLAT
eukprot:jgi/Astpho2/7155/Aster-01479